MVDNVVKFPGVDDIMVDDFDSVGPHVSIDAVLDGAKDIGLEDVILIGRNAEGSFTSQRLRVQLPVFFMI